MVKERFHNYKDVDEIKNPICLKVAAQTEDFYADAARLPYGKDAWSTGFLSK